MSAALVSTIYKNLNSALKFYRPSNKFSVIFVGYVDHYFVAMRRFYYLHRPSRTVNLQRRPQNRFIKRPFSKFLETDFPRNVILSLNSVTLQRNATRVKSIARERKSWKRESHTHTADTCSAENLWHPVYQALVNNTTVYLNVPDGFRMPLGNAREQPLYLYARTRELCIRERAHISARMIFSKKGQHPRTPPIYVW